MSNILTLGLITEGPTDVRFLQSIVRRTFEEVALKCPGEIEIYDPIVLPKEAGPFVEKVINAAKKAEMQGLMVLCVHTDADNASDTEVRERKIKPALERLESENQPICKNLVSVIPIQMTEAWMLADIPLLKEELGTNESKNVLGLLKKPESYSDPKDSISQAIRIASNQRKRRRRKQLKIGELYLPLGQKTNLNELRKLSSYQKFESEVNQAFHKLNYLFSP